MTDQKTENNADVNVALNKKKLWKLFCNKLCTCVSLHSQGKLVSTGIKQ